MLRGEVNRSKGLGEEHHVLLLAHSCFALCGFVNETKIRSCLEYETNDLP